MTGDFTDFIRQAIDCYESDQGLAWLHLDIAQSQLQSEKGDRTLKDEKKAAKNSTKRTRAAMRSKVLEKEASLREKSETFEKIREEMTPSSKENPEAYWEHLRERQRQTHFEYLLDVTVWKDNHERRRNGEDDATRQEILEFWGKEGILSLEKCSDWKEIEEEYDLALRSEPNFETYLLRRHLDWLDSSAGKIEADGPISFRNSIPEHLKLYMYEAGWCNLHNLDAACASLCGAILEEALRIKLKEKGKKVDGVGALGGVIQAASTPDSVLLTPLLTPRATDHAREVMRVRNLTAHGSREFADRSELDRKASLPLTMELLETLFAPEN